MYQVEAGRSNKEMDDAIVTELFLISIGMVIKEIPLNGSSEDRADLIAYYTDLADCLGVTATVISRAIVRLEKR